MMLCTKLNKVAQINLDVEHPWEYSKEGSWYVIVADEFFTITTDSGNILDRIAVIDSPKARVAVLEELRVH